MKQDDSGSVSTQLRNLAVASILEVTSAFMYVGSLDALLQKIVKTVAETYGLAKVHIGILEKDSGLFATRAAYGFTGETEKAIRNVKYSMERMRRDLRPELKIGRNAYYVPAEDWEPDEEDMLFITRPERIDRARRFPDEWHECDYIDFLMYARDGSLLGYLEIDEPDNNKVPSEETIRAIEVFSDLAAIAIQNAQLYEEIEADRKKIELLLDLIGHDVNNYAQGINGFIELAMARPDIPQPARKSLAKAHDLITNLNKLMRNVNVYAKTESAEARNLRPTNIVEVVKEAFSAVQSSVGGKDVKLNLADDGTPKMSDMNELAKEVFLNLFSNAVKFDEHDPVEIDVDVSGTCSNKREFWCVSVADRGPGIEDDMKQRVFDRFAQAPPSSIGTGLGLHIAKTLVESYKGRIWVEDRVKGDRSKGSVFKIELPKSSGEA